jgi:hypothetical protein
MNPEDLKDINIGSGAIRMGGKHKKEPVLRAFNSPEEQAANADQAYNISTQRVNKIELECGFDVRSRESVIAFKTGYALRGGGVLLKEIPKDINPEEKGIVLIELGDNAKKFWVVSVGPLINDVKKGDVVYLKGSISMLPRTFNKVNFIETDGYNITGVFISEEELADRISKAENRSRTSASGVDEFIENTKLTEK